MTHSVTWNFTCDCPNCTARSIAEGTHTKPQGWGQITISPNSGTAMGVAKVMDLCPKHYLELQALLGKLWN